MPRTVSLFALTFALATIAAAQPAPKSAFFTTSDGVRLHYLDAGSGPAIVFVPGWTMPANIWEKQISHFAQNYHVLAVDPRSQGDSAKPADGNYVERRARDYRELVDRLKLAPAVLVGWSMGVPELLAYVDQFGPASVRALVLVDSKLGTPSDLVPQYLRLLRRLQMDRLKFTEEFVHGMYKKPQTETYLERITNASLRTPSNTAVALVVGVLGFEGWTSGIERYGDHPLLIACTRDTLNKAESLRAKRPSTRVELFEDAGHALFVDDAGRFNSLLDQFVASQK